MLTLADALEAITNFRPQADHIITEAAIDSRQVIPGALFVAIPGEKADGHNYVDAAFQRGASYALIQRDVPDASFRTLDLRGGLSVDSAESLRTSPLPARGQFHFGPPANCALLAPKTQPERDRHHRKRGKILHQGNGG